MRIIEIPAKEFVKSRMLSIDFKKIPTTKDTVINENEMEIEIVHYFFFENKSYLSTPNNKDSIAFRPPYAIKG